MSPSMCLLRVMWVEGHFLCSDRVSAMEHHQYTLRWKPLALPKKMAQGTSLIPGPSSHVLK